MIILGTKEAKTTAASFFDTPESSPTSRLEKQSLITTINHSAMASLAHHPLPISRKATSQGCSSACC